MPLPLLNVNADVVRQALCLTLADRPETAHRVLNLPVQKAMAAADIDPEITPINVRFIDARTNADGSVAIGERYHWHNGRWSYAAWNGESLSDAAERLCHSITRQQKEAILHAADNGGWFGGLYGSAAPATLHAIGVLDDIDNPALKLTRLGWLVARAWNGQAT